MTKHKTKFVRNSGMKRRERAERQNVEMESAIYAFVKILAAIALRDGGTLVLTEEELSKAAHHTLTRDTSEKGLIKFTVAPMAPIQESDPEIALQSAQGLTLPDEVAESISATATAL